MRFEDLLDRLVWRVVATNLPDIVINCRRVTLATPADIADPVLRKATPPVLIETVDDAIGNR
jgi:hypothetical protein